MARTTVNIQIMKLENRVATSGVELDPSDPRCPKLEPDQIVPISSDDVVLVRGSRVDFAILEAEKLSDGTTVRRAPLTGKIAEEIDGQWYVGAEQERLLDLLKDLLDGDNPRLVRTEKPANRPLRFKDARTAKMAIPSYNPIRDSEEEEQARILAELKEGNLDV